jgi:hypothetical protein
MGWSCGQKHAGPDGPIANGRFGDSCIATLVHDDLAVPTGIGRDSCACETYRSTNRSRTTIKGSCHLVRERIRCSWTIGEQPPVTNFLLRVSTLVKFQRTRGVLRLMAAVIHSLWEKGDKNPPILPANIS